jgi:hypothetical protein
MRFAKASRRLAHSGISVTGDYGSILFNMFAEQRDAITDRVISSHPSSVSLRGKSWLVKSQDITGDNIKEGDRYVMISRLDADAKGIVIDGDMTVVIEGVTWSIVIIERDSSDYKLLVRK